MEIFSVKCCHCSKELTYADKTKKGSLGWKVECPHCKSILVAKIYSRVLVSLLMVMPIIIGIENLSNIIGNGNILISYIAIILWEVLVMSIISPMICRFDEKK